MPSRLPFDPCDIISCYQQKIRWHGGFYLAGAKSARQRVYTVHMTQRGGAIGHAGKKGERRKYSQSAVRHGNPKVLANQTTCSFFLLLKEREKTRIPALALVLLSAGDPSGK